MLSLALLKEPLIENGKINKGAIIMSDVDSTLVKFPTIKDYFYIIERRGWEGINMSKYADIKLVEDLSVWKETTKKFPEAILLDIAGADFVDTDKFKPLNIEKEYTGIQISTWQKFKRPELFFYGIKLLPDKKFLKFGHLIYGNEEELNYKNKFIHLSRKDSLNVDLPYADLRDNKGLPNDSEEINLLINKSKMGILTSKIEGINRFKLECLSANIPVLVPNDVNTPLKKHINDKTGLFYDPTPEGLAEAINIVEENYSSFSPREYVLRNTGSKNSMVKLKKALESLAKRDGSKNIYQAIYWDGRNQSLIWEDRAENFIRDILNTIKSNQNYTCDGENMRLIIVRHGETEENKKGIIQGHLPGRLTELGIMQAKKLALKLKEEKIDAIYSSDLARASDTAKEIAKFHPNAKLFFVSELREKNQGSLSGKLIKEIDWSKLRDGEKKEAMFERAKIILEKTYKDYKGKTVLFVAHGGIIRVLMSLLLNKSLEEIKKMDDYGNAAISIFIVKKNENHEVILINSKDHLK